MKTLTDLANSANMSQSALSNIINGRRRPSWPKAKALAKATGTKPDLWLDGTPEQMMVVIVKYKTAVEGIVA